MSECLVCSYTDKEVTIINNLCSVHTCEVCKHEGYADGAFNGKILCDDCHLDLSIEREEENNGVR
jgi:hypothetical protein